jgi:hypothetical protein
MIASERLQWRQLFSLIRKHLLSLGLLNQWSFVMFGDGLTAIGRPLQPLRHADNDN